MLIELEILSSLVFTARVASQYPSIPRNAIFICLASLGYSKSAQFLKIFVNYFP